MSYVDGFIVPVPKSKLEAYREFARLAATVWREYGALDYREYIADDAKPGTLTSFPQSVLLEPEETVVFGWIVYKSRAQRDEINAKVMADPRMSSVPPAQWPFDGKRMIFGGFSPLFAE